MNGSEHNARGLIRDGISEAEIVSDVSMQETVRDAVKLSELLKDALPTYSYAQPHEKEQIIRVIFSELTLSENTLDYKCRKGFQALASRFVESHDLTENRTPINALKRRCPNR